MDATETPRPSPTPEDQSGSPFGELSIAAAGAVISALSFISSTFLGIRKERRDAQKDKLELERAQIELDRLKAKQDQAGDDDQAP